MRQTTKNNVDRPAAQNILPCMDNEKELKDLTERVIAAGGRAGRKPGYFTLSVGASDDCKRGDEHHNIKGLYFNNRDIARGVSRWMDAKRFADKTLATREWGVLNRDLNRDKIYKKNKIWREENKEKVNAASKRWYEENREKAADASRRYYQNNKERLLKDQKAWQRNNKDKVNAASKRWRVKNPEKVQSNTARYRARKLEAADPTTNRAVIDSRYSAARYLKDITGKNWEVDHTRPLKLGGKHHEDNMQVVPQEWNQSKGARHNGRWFEDSDRYRLATEIEKRFEREAKNNVDTTTG